MIRLLEKIYPLFFKALVSLERSRLIRILSREEREEAWKNHEAPKGGQNSRLGGEAEQTEDARPILGVDEMEDGWNGGVSF